MRVLLFLLLVVLIFAEDFTPLKLEEPYEFQAHSGFNSLFKIDINDSEKKSLTIRVIGDSNPPACLNEEGIQLNSTINPKEVMDRPMWIENGSSCMAITPSSNPPFIPKASYYISFKSQREMTNGVYTIIIQTV